MENKQKNKKKKIEIFNSFKQSESIEIFNYFLLLFVDF